MPTTKSKNLIYRFALPLKGPRPGAVVLTGREGHPAACEKAYASLLKKYRVLGSACLLASGGEQALLLSSSEVPKHTASRGSMFRVASITKMAAALGILVLAEKGLLDPDQPFADFFPGENLPPRARNMPLRHLLSHTSGLADPPDLEARLLSGEPFPSFLEACLHQEPGKEFRYSNFGFGLLGCVMEAVSGLPVSRFMEQEVFQPLGMHATLDASTLSPSSILPVCRVLPFRPDQEVRITRLGSVPLTAPDPLRHYGHTAGSMYTDVDSLYRMILCLQRDGVPLLSGGRAADMKKQHAAYGRRSPTLSYGLGLLLIRDPSLSSSVIYGHQGYAYGCADGAFWEESTGNTVIFLNGGCSEERLGMLGRCNYDLLKLFLGKEFPLWHRIPK